MRDFLRDLVVAIPLLNVFSGGVRTNSSGERVQIEDDFPEVPRMESDRF